MAPARIAVAAAAAWDDVRRRRFVGRRRCCRRRGLSFGIVSVDAESGGAIAAPSLIEEETVSWSIAIIVL